MYPVGFIYYTGIRGKCVSLKNTELYLPVKSYALKRGGLNKRGRVGSFLDILH